MIHAQLSVTWTDDQRDPDNWLTILEFGVLPAEVQFEGFAHPIVGPVADEKTDFLAGVRVMVTTIRHLARMHFSSLMQLRQEALVAMDTIWPMHDESAADVRSAQLSEKQVAAVRYQFCMLSLQTAISQCHRDGPLRWRLECAQGAATNVASTAGMLLDWLQNKPIDPASEVLARMKRGASTGGLASGRVRRANARVPDHAALLDEKARLRQQGKPEREIASLLAQRYHCTPDHIRKMLKRQNAIEGPSGRD